MKKHFNPKTYYKPREYSEKILKRRRQELFVNVVLQMTTFIVLLILLSIFREFSVYLVFGWLIIEFLFFYAMIGTWRRNVKAKKVVGEWKSVEDLRRMDPFDFEHYVAELYKKKGYHNVQVTQELADGGIDITMERGKERIAVQCKRYREDKQVGVSEVREFYGSVHLNKFSRGVFITLSSFSKQTWDEFRGSNVFLMDGRSFRKFSDEEK